MKAMKKMTSKSVKRIAATAMAMTLAVPTTFCMKAVTVEASVLDDALVTYDFEDGTDALTREGETSLKLVDGKPVIENGEYVKEASTALPEVVEEEGTKVLEFKNSQKVDKYEKTESDELDAKYPVGSLIQLKGRVGGRVKVDNPFKGMTFEGENVGATISYWVKVPLVKDETVKDDSGNYIDRGANSTTVVFNNADRVVKQKDDYAKHLACVAYDTAAEKNDTEALKDYDMGTQEIMKDAEGNAYVVYRNYGKLLRFNRNYPSQAASAEAVKAATGTGKAMDGGWYIPSEISASQAKDGKIDVTAADGTKYKISSLQNAGSTTPDSSQYDLFRYSYAAETDFEKGVSSKSKIREESIRGSLQISTDNDFGFREDDYRTESYTGDDGLPKSKAVGGAVITNPNSEDYNNYQDFEGSNQLFFDGDERVTSVDEDAPEKWHYVTVVMQNDWVVTYVDGVAADPETEYFYCKDVPGLSSSDRDFKDLNAGKMFNKGKGLRAPFSKQPTNVSEWPVNGTASASPANSLGITMLDWLADQNTEMYFGGTSFCAEMLTQSYGTKEGVKMDDISFWGTALTEDEAVELYEEVAGKFQTTVLGDVDGNGKVELADAQLTLKSALKLATLTSAQETAADVDKNGKVELADAQKILKVALKIESGF